MRYWYQTKDNGLQQRQKLCRLELYTVDHSLIKWQTLLEPRTVANVNTPAQQCGRVAHVWEADSSPLHCTLTE